MIRRRLLYTDIQGTINHKVYFNNFFLKIVYYLFQLLSIPCFLILCSIYNYFIMPRTEGALDFSKFQRGRIVGQFESGLIQRKISNNFSKTLATVNRLIVKCTGEVKKCTASRSGCPGPSDRTLHLVKRKSIILVARLLT